MKTPHPKCADLNPLVIRAVGLADELRMIISEINHELVGAHLPVQARAASSPSLKSQPEIASFERTLSADQLRVRLNILLNEYEADLNSFENSFVNSNLEGSWEFTDKQYLVCERLFKKFGLPLVPDDEIDNPPEVERKPAPPVTDMDDLPF